ncbi:major facilitator superfamily domain-containing protein [Naematelia encephala]|uniref:Major facilitator superfamily domain-containing protein n=1 Tax=Naematelia encephala TaxID=71784 RepID=A0A1Y2AYE9_9TREE|nr:major facilitator superfamily domain-containing protein [Naematelia encephala]
MSHMSAGPTPAMGATAQNQPPPLNIEAINETLQAQSTDSDDTATIGRGNPAFSNGNFNSSHPLFNDLAPDDSYLDGVYWADLPLKQRHAWINKQSNAEALREIKHVGSMFKRDPLSPLGAYCKRYVIGGFGLFTEGYTLFSIGNLSSLYSAVWPHCWGSKPTECNTNWISAVTYMQIIGIMVGQVVVGFEGDWIGRKFGLVQDALVMFLGLVMLTASWGTNLNGWVICYAWSQFIYGMGVGGEYPMTSTTALESRSVSTSQRDDKLHRGRNVVLAFLMQGWGQLFNLAVLIILLLIFNGGGFPPYSEKTAQWTFRLSFAIMGLMTLWLAYYRYYKKAYSSRALERSKAGHRVNQSGYDVTSLKLTFSHFGGRLIGTTTGWLFNDFLFYGNKLFQSSFITIIDPAAKGNVTTTWLWSLVNVGVSLCGYYMAALMIDWKFYGRRKMQIVGFLADGILFLIPAIWYNQLQEPKHIKGFQTIYYLSSFFQQFGPNCTTFLVAAEVYPISVRATAHGLSAASGKLGALLPAIIYNYVDSRTRFWIVCWFGFAGWIVTLLFIPDTTGLDLREQDRYWSFVRRGAAHEYHGIAVHPRHLSWWERYALKRHLAYDPELDRKQKVQELRAAYETKMRNATAEGTKAEHLMEEDDHENGYSTAAHAYFHNEKTAARPTNTY